MEAKKSKKADLKSKRVLFFEIGIILSIGIVFAAFQWTTDENTMAIDFGAELDFDIEEEWIPVNREIEEKKQELQDQTVEVIEIVEDTEDIEDVFIADTEGNLDFVIKVIALEDEKPDETEPEYFVTVEEMPIYPGGKSALMRDIMSNVDYPDIAIEYGIEGKVFVQFIVNKKGEVDKVQVARSVDPSLDKEAIRVVKLIEGWTPGMQRGKPVNVRFTVLINFKLN